MEKKEYTLIVQHLGATAAGQRQADSNLGTMGRMVEADTRNVAFLMFAFPEADSVARVEAAYCTWEEAQVLR